MEFTYNEYGYLLDLIIENGYEICDYTNYKGFKRPVILRHDVDNSLDKALEFAEFENKRGVKSTYFVLITSDFYNILSKKSEKIIKEIISLGHNIGLHFDEKRCTISDEKELERLINREASYLGGVLGKGINTVSMHRPSKWILDNNIQFENIINTYSSTFLNDFKYLSDSRMHWREDVINIIKSGQYNKLHILTHPFWYSEQKETMKEKLLKSINQAKIERYKNIDDNFRDLNEVLRLGDIE